MITGGSIGFSIYVIPMLILTGLLLLRIDVKKYALNGMDKEAKTSRFLGWFNFVLGVLLIIANSFLQIW